MAKYRKLTKLDQGGFADVWLCRRSDNGRRFAKKQLRSDAGDGAIKRFRREFRMLSKLDHPNVIKVLGRHLKKEPYWYVMPLYEHSLQEKLGTMMDDESRIARVFTAVLDAMEYAHSEGVVHRDLKPANILMNSDSDIVVADFGIGLKIDAETTRQTLSGVPLGTSLYMAPEQWSSAHEADERSDVFALGRILDELYGGPFTERGARSPALSPGIAFLVERCTEDDPERRFQSVAGLKQAYLTVLNPLEGGVRLADFTDLRTRLSVASSDYDGGELDEFLSLFLELYPEEDELLVDTMLALHPDAVASLYERGPGSMKELIKAFCKEVSRRRWPFRYTDHISDGCLGVFRAIGDPQLRAELVACLVSLGVSHDRWKVLRDAASMIHQMKRPEEVLSLVERLKGVPEWNLESMGEYVRLDRVKKPLRSFFKPEQAEE